jgi:hypothetical protein
MQKNYTKDNNIMSLSQHDKECLIEKLPDIELSYDNNLHKKVYADIHLVIPKGKKTLTWFTSYKSKNICVIMELDKNCNISHMYSIPVCFSTELAYNTLLYGTIVNINSTTFFSIEDIYYYKNKDIRNKFFKYKLDIMNDLFSNHLKNTRYFNNNFIFTIPIIKNNYNDAYQETQFISYSVYGIQARMLNSNVSSGIYKIVEDIQEVVFKVKADINQDIYNLYCLDTNKNNGGVKEIFYNIAMIPDYKTSVYMNSLFRTIKENNNLDLLEESDDDEEFENINEDKFVNLNKTITMKCVYMARFKKWKPVSITKNGDKIITLKELYAMQKK